MDASESLPPGSVPVAIGDVMAGKYRVDRILGVGGMGVVVAATHLQLDQRVALKFMLPAGMAHPALVERFSREARAAVRLRSDHVARVLDVGTLDTGSPYIVMEYLEGRDLGSLVETGGPLPVAAAVDCVLQACDAVAEAHALGIVHRDLKPRNLFLTERNDGRALVKVLDFGISKHKSAGGDLSLTRTTEVMGSPNYMSPEQLKSAKAADERSDIWALGVILYELLTGNVPFVAESVTQLTAMVLTEVPRAVDALRPEVPRDLSRIIQRCLEKEPEKRFPSVAMLAAALEPFAPEDTRELAHRIARIASGAKPMTSVPPAASSSSLARIVGGTSVTWSGRTELAPGKGKRVGAIVAIAGTAVVAVVAVVVVAMRPGRTAASAASNPSAATATVAPTGSAATAATTGNAPPTVSLAPPTATPSATTASATTAPTATSSSSARTPAHAPAAHPGPAAGTASSYVPPRYRTSW